MTPIYTAAGIRRIEQLAAPGAGAPALMERAGLAAAECARQMCDDRARDILVLAGPGNNGGDAFEAAAHLKRAFYRVHVVFAGARDKLPRDATRALARWEAAGGTLLAAIPADVRFGLALDGLFGIGLARPLGGAHAALVRALSALGVPVLALDAPSGIDGDTGVVMGVAVRATRTLTFIAHKPGLLTLDGPDHCGDLRVDTLGVDAAALLAPEGELVEAGVVRAAVPPRPRNFHKGLAGSVGILGGAAGMAGAALLAGRAALKCGAGRTYVGMLSPLAVDAAQPELMLRAPKDLLQKDLLTVLAAGPGLGRSEAAKKLLDAALASKLPLVLDADALNLVAANRAAAKKVAARRTPTIMTPHPAEAARLLGRETREVQADRVASAAAIAKRYGAIAVLKGNGTVIAAPDGKWWINASGNPGMASAGMGDVLTGMIAALLAQGASPADACTAAVYLHGAAADRLAASGVGPVGLSASEVIDAARALLNAPALG
jgi:hydroxyethylthiazole kinase-like uncharacterized protein yjeF